MALVSGSPPKHKVEHVRRTQLELLTTRQERITVICFTEVECKNDLLMLVDPLVLTWCCSRGPSLSHLYVRLEPSLNFAVLK